MRAYAEEGLSIVEVLPEPPNKFYVFIDKGLYVVILMPVIALLFTNIFLILLQFPLESFLLYISYFTFFMYN